MARDWNQQIIEEFRANGGRVGGRFEGLPLLLLHHRGARSGKERVNSLAYQALEGGALAVFASKGGAPRNPDRYHNVRANPEVEVEVAGRRIRARARVAEGEERERIWRAQASEVPAFGAYQTRSRPASGRPRRGVLLHRSRWASRRSVGLEDTAKRIRQLGL